MTEANPSAIETALQIFYDTLQHVTEAPLDLNVLTPQPFNFERDILGETTEQADQNDILLVNLQHKGLQYILYADNKDVVFVALDPHEKYLRFMGSMDMHKPEPDLGYFKEAIEGGFKLAA